MDLVPFDQTASFQVSVWPAFGTSDWEVTYEVRGAVQDLLWDRSLAGETTDLWKRTCMELFVSIDGKRYFEWNGSPSGAWSVFQFSDYRAPVPYTHVGGSPSLKRAPDDPRMLRLVWTLPSALFPGVDLSQAEISLNAVVLSKTSAVASYFALKHGGDKPDFHHKAGWIKVKEEWVQR